MEINKYRTRFSLISSGKNSKEKQIFLVVTIERNEIFYYSGYRVHPDNFIKETIKLTNSTVYIQQVKKSTFNKSGDSAEAINARLRELENATLTVFEQNYKGRDIDFSKDDFKKDLQTELGEGQDEEPTNTIEQNILSIHNIFIEYLKDKKSYHRYHQADHNKLVEFSEKKGNSTKISDFDVDRFYKSISKDIKANSVITIMKRIRSFFNWAKNKKYIKGTPFDDYAFTENIGVEIYSEPVCMTRDELTKLFLSKQETAHKELVKDMFCLQAAIGCRVGDFLRLTYNNIQDGRVIYFPQKTSEFADKVIVPLSSRANEIIDKYRNKTKDNLIMPFMNSVEYNKTLKNVFKTAELDRVIVRYDRDLKKEVYDKLCDIATSHLARRTFVDILCQAGEPIHVVASMSGHSENSKAFDRYRRRPEQLQIQAVNRSMD